MIATTSQALKGRYKSLGLFHHVRHRAMPCAIEFRPFRADSYVEFTLTVGQTVDTQQPINARTH
ncbi:MAG: hypothetical protein WBV94_31470, partial [Blastocatellia bacterium]